MCPKREIRPKKGPPIIDYSQFKPRFKGKVTEQMKFCAKILNELMAKKNAVSIGHVNKNLIIIGVDKK